MCYWIEGKATCVIEINIEELWNNYWWLPISLTGDAWFSVVVVVFVIFSSSVFLSLFSPHLHACIFHLPLFLWPHEQPSGLDRCCLVLSNLATQTSSHGVPCRLLTRQNPLNHHPPHQGALALVGTLKFGKHCSKTQTHTEQIKPFANSQIKLKDCALIINSFNDTVWTSLP